MPERQYRVYVIELSKKVFTESTKFRAANPQFNGVLQCLYVGMTSKTPRERFEQHKSGYRNKKGHKLSSNIVQKYGMYLRPSLYNHIDPMSTRSVALKMEEKLALELRRQRYAVWFNWHKRRIERISKNLKLKSIDKRLFKKRANRNLCN